MDNLFIENVVILICATMGFLYGGYRLLKEKQPLYASMITMGMGCLLFGRLYQCFFLSTGGSMTDHFQIGILGVPGAFSFFFSANYGQIDSLVDDRSKGFRKYRAIALTGPLVIFAIYFGILFSPAVLSLKIAYAISTIIIGSACYFHLKHLIIPDVEGGIVRCLRPYNLLALIMGLFSMGEMSALAWNSEKMFFASGMALGVTTLAVVSAMDWGVRKWKV